MTALSKKRLFIVSGIVLVAGLAWEFVPIQVTHSSGGYDLTIRMKNTSKKPIWKVSCQAVAKAEHAQETLEYLQLLELGWSTTVEPFRDEPIVLSVPTSGRTSPWGRELSRFQLRHLVVIVEFLDGERIGKLVEIPDSRVAREMEVSVP